MPFFKEVNKKIQIKKVTLQVRIPCIRKKILGKRVLSSVSQIRRKGSLTIEAAMVLPLFLFFMVLLMMPMKILNDGRKIQIALERTGEEVSQYVYLYDELEIGTKLKKKGLGKIPDEFLSTLSEQAVLILVRKRVEGRVGFEHLTSVSFARSSILRDGETIDLVMDYQVKLPFSILGKRSVPMTARCYRRAWIGNKKRAVEASEENEELVYIGKGSTRYHKDRTCHYLYNTIKKISFQELKTVRNLNGGKYKPCSRCGELAGEQNGVYILPSGEKYHSTKNCSAITAYVKAVPLSKVRHLGACSYCSQ
ncbi:TadE family protein [Clostridium sp. E02]|uniref:TadE/TadG family type IV pilus assembly protein n=1 Tax=Clostridium sp. E02 TaxID=2487134 RepID=UPI000F51EA90|nr:TadE family protein [Clostridium sp. E02]